ncbi:Uncharacterised protein [Vibrio cholerae]|nr:Uncharacterised protein [Vibrio cholerae]
MRRAQKQAASNIPITGSNPPSTPQYNSSLCG